MPSLDLVSVLVGAAGMAVVWGLVTVWALCAASADRERWASRSLPPEDAKDPVPCPDVSTMADDRLDPRQW